MDLYIAARGHGFDVRDILYKYVVKYEWLKSSLRPLLIYFYRHFYLFYNAEINREIFNLYYI